MEPLDLAQLQRLLFMAVGLVVVIMIALIAYLILAGRRVRAESISRKKDDEIVIRPSLRVVGQILSLVRDEAGQPLQVEVDGVKYDSLAAVQDPQVKRQIVDAAMELIRFTGVLGQTAVAPAPIEKTETWREDLRQGSQAELELARISKGDLESPTPPSPEVEEQFFSLLAEMGQETSKPEMPGVIGAVQQRLAPKPGEPEKPRTFVDDIEDIVQRRVQLIPALLGRGLHVRSDSVGQVVLLFDGREYQSVDDIPNLTARQLVKDAIQEWDETN
jgi:hypothetical protein